MDELGGEQVQKVALVTGAASGIGCATARLLSERGYHVLAADLSLERTATALADVPTVMPIELDVRAACDAARAVAMAEDHFGGLDAVAHIAGVEVDRPVDRLTEDEWDWVIDTNLKGTYVVCAAAIPALRRRGGGAVVTTASVLGRVALPGATAYGASKAGVEALTRAMALDYAHDGIRVNCVVPGSTDTPLMWASSLPDEIEEARRSVVRQIPLGRVAKPRDIATCIAFLLSDDACFVTGASLVADGGELARW